MFKVNVAGDYKNRNLTLDEARRVLPGLFYVFLYYHDGKGLLIGAFESEEETADFIDRCKASNLSATPMF